MEYYSAIKNDWNWVCFSSSQAVILFIFNLKSYFLEGIYQFQVKGSVQYMEIWHENFQLLNNLILSNIIWSDNALQAFSNKASVSDD